MNEIVTAVSEAYWTVTTATALARNATCNATNYAADRDTWAAVIAADFARMDIFYTAIEDAIKVIS